MGVEMCIRDRINSLSDVPVVELKEVFPDKKHGYGVVNIITRPVSYTHLDVYKRQI